MSRYTKKQTKANELNNIYYEFYETVKDLMESDVVLGMKKYTHHCDTTCYQHCINVAYYNYVICKKYGLDARAAARAGILHDLFLYDWHTHRRLTKDYFHALTHPRRALKNARRFFKLTKLEEEIILKHMWPLTVIPPMSWEAFIITITDKYCGFCEVADYYSKRYAPKWVALPFGKIHV